MLSTVFELTESAHDPNIVYVKVMVLGLMAIISLVFVYYSIKNH